MPATVLFGEFSGVGMNNLTVFCVFHTPPKPTVVGCSLFQCNSLEERYCLTVVTYLHVHTPHAGYLATSGKVSDNSKLLSGFCMLQ
ncbi:MAG: hypothetical protein ACL7BU_16600 [Candidatus Phlomobacter fragariae]